MQMPDRPKVHPRFNKEGLRSSIDRIRNHDASGDPQITADAKFLVDELPDLVSWLEGEIRRRDVLLTEAHETYSATITQLELEMATYHRTQERLQAEAADQHDQDMSAITARL